MQCFPATLYHFQRHPICLFDISARSIWFAISTIVIRPAWLEYDLAQFSCTKVILLWKIPANSLRSVQIGAASGPHQELYFGHPLCRYILCLTRGLDGQVVTLLGHRAMAFMLYVRWTVSPSFLTKIRPDSVKVHEFLTKIDIEILNYIWIVA